MSHTMPFRCNGTNIHASRVNAKSYAFCFLVDTRIVREYPAHKGTEYSLTSAVADKYLSVRSVLDGETFSTAYKHIFVGKKLHTAFGFGIYRVTFATGTAAKLSAVVLQGCNIFKKRIGATKKSVICVLQLLVKNKVNSETADFLVKVDCLNCALVVNNS